MKQLNNLIKQANYQVGGRVENHFYCTAGSQLINYTGNPVIDRVWHQFQQQLRSVSRISNQTQQCVYQDKIGRK